MSHTYCSVLLHCVCSTKERCRSIPFDLQPRLWAYIGGLAREHGAKALAVGGYHNHVHILLSLPATKTIADAMREIKAASSCEIKAASSWWMCHTGEVSAFEWQEGYGVFSLGPSQLEMAIAYINNQPEHHRRQSFDEEFLAILKKCQVDYSPKYVLG